MNRTLNRFFEKVTGKKIIPKPRPFLYYVGKVNRAQAKRDALDLLESQRKERARDKAIIKEMKEVRKLGILTTNDIDPRTMKLYPDYKKRRAKREKARR